MSDGNAASPMRRYANIEGEYRWWLERDWSQPGTERGAIDLLAFVMLNPSTADGEVDDATIRRCVGFAKREGAWRMDVFNLFALRSTDPAALLTHPDPIGIANDELLRSVSQYGGHFKTVVAWGAHKMVTPERVTILTESAAAAGTTLWCLGTTKSGAPRHPLYVKADTPLVPWEPTHVG